MSFPLEADNNNDLYARYKLVPYLSVTDYSAETNSLVGGGVADKNKDFSLKY